MAPIRATGVDVDERAIGVAKRAQYDLGYDHLSFYCADAITYTPTTEVDCLLLMDVLEHVRNPAEVVRRLDPYIKKGGYVVISVPTPVYPRVFGRRFHEEIGHLVDGYSLRDLGCIIPEEYALVQYAYHTGVLAWPACFLYYRYVRNVRSRSLRLVLGALLVPFRWFDLVKGEKTSASLFAVYQKPG